MSDGTEEATPKRLKKAREEGDSGTSSFATQAVAFLCAAAVAPSLVRALANYGTTALRATMTHLADLDGTFDGWTLARDVTILALPMLAAAAATAAVASALQAGGVIATKRLTPNLGRLNPIEGLKGLFSFARIFAVARALLFAAAIAWIASRVLLGYAPDVARSSGRLEKVPHLAGEIAQSLAMKTAVVGLFLAAFDLVIVRTTWRRRLRMTKDEVKREHRESEGDPHVKAARERARHEMLEAVTIANVKNASVVVVNPTHVACALRYEEGEGDQAPVLVASGEGEMAKRIIEAARAYGIPVLRDVPLARALVELEIGDAIPEALYEAVAEILRDAWEESPPSLR